MSEKEFEFVENQSTEETVTETVKEAQEDIPKVSEPINVQHTENSYGGFSQKWNYERYEQKRKKTGRGLKAFAIVMSFLFVMTLTAFGTWVYFEYRSESDTPLFSFVSDKEKEDHTNAMDKVNFADKTPTDPAPVVSYTGEELTSQEIIRMATPGVVGIKTMIEQYYSFYGTQTYEGVGSGFIITEDGYIVTNYHVIEDAVSVKVVLSDGKEYEAETVGYDILSDVAVLKIDETGLPALVIGDSSASLAGDTVIAIGCPSGIDLAGTATRGMISMVDREISITDYYGRVQKKMNVIQTDAAINPGNSGGPLLNMRGEVIGINTLKLSSSTYEGIGFALPINGVMELVDQICKNGAVVERPTDSFVTGKAALAISYRAITSSDSKNYDLPEGILVVLVARGGAAHKAGIKSGDIIVEFAGEKITTAEALTGLLSEKRPGDVVKVKIYRDGDYKDIDVTLTEASE